MFIRKIKTDAKDSFIIAELIRFGRYAESNVAQDRLLALKELCRNRFYLVDMAGDLKRKLIALIDRVFPEYEAQFDTIFCKSSVALLKKYPTPQKLSNAHLDRLNFSTGKDRACVRAHLRRCLYTADLQKRLTHTVTHTVTHTRKRADGSSGNRDVKEYFNSSENDQKRLENNIFRIFLLFVISRSGVRVRLPAPIFPQRSKLNMGEFPSGQRGQTVNLLSVTSVVRIHLPPPKSALKSADFCFIRTF